MSEPTKNRGFINLGLAVQAREIYDETGLAPRQMQEQIKELREAIATALAAMVGYVPLSDKTIEIARAALANTERKTA